MDTRRPVPAQLPADLPAFVGRTAELARLDAARVVILVGAPGIGKTALAVHWAHRVAERFPDGQFYVDLRGYDPAGPLSPAAAIRGILDALGVAPADVPGGLAELSALYRSLVAGRRIVLVLENARDADQVRPLLPGAPHATVLVTGLVSLTPLVVRHGAQPVALDALDATEARELLRGRLGAHRVAAEPAAVADLVQRCAGVPLALAIVAAKALTRPATSLTALAAELRAAGAGPTAMIRAHLANEQVLTRQESVSAPVSRLIDCYLSAARAPQPRFFAA
jgi:predicted ATPase